MYVVTGATGNTGTVVASKLLAKGQPVRVLGRSADRLQPLVATGAAPCVCDVTDTRALTRAFAGAKAVYVMIPPSLADPDYRALQDRVTAALATALAEAGTKYAVTLSSIGADKPDKTGPVVGLHNLEQKLNRIDGLNVLYLRAGYFMENTLGLIHPIKAHGTAAGPLRPDLKLPLIATRDIGAAAAEALLKLDFRRQETRELHGPRDLSMAEVTTIIGKAIKRPGLAYMQLPDEEVRTALLQMDLSPNSADLILEMAVSLNSGYMKALERRSPHNTTPTTYETFVAEELLPRFEGRPGAE